MFFCRILQFLLLKISKTRTLIYEWSDTVFSVEFSVEKTVDSENRKKYDRDQMRGGEFYFT